VARTFHHPADCFNRNPLVDRRLLVAVSATPSYFRAKLTRCVGRSLPPATKLAGDGAEHDSTMRECAPSARRSLNPADFAAFQLEGPD